MSDDIVISMLGTSEVEQQKQVWVGVIEQLRQRIVTLNEESAAVQRQVLTLDGAIGACDVFLHKMNTPVN